MTKDEILKLEAGRELDAMVWQALNGQEINLYTCRYVDGDYQPHGGYPTGHISPPNYSTDIAAAWKVLECISAKYECSTAVGREYPYGRMMYVARFVGGRLAYDTPELKLYVLASSASLAICRAALLAVMEVD